MIIPSDKNISEKEKEFDKTFKIFASGNRNCMNVSFKPRHYSIHNKSTGSY